jgi:hypothetical protein
MSQNTLKVTPSPTINTDKIGTMIDVAYQLEDAITPDWIDSVSGHIFPPENDQLATSELKAMAIARSNEILSGLAGQVESHEQ